ncbi:MAG: Asp-tRNA(Asn)/Glu-tRNA(Gln) amidotransferase subunit GatC [Sulfuriferula sp.]|nr:Asp-tRNA(Asn)/Glu-tRNA(Gln) amidotransferase subunit GatC [Sulfuriferula sp.]
MSLTLQDVKRVATLARIAVTDDEAVAYQQQLNGIFGLIAEMQAVDTAGVEPMSHAQELSQRLRDDLVTETDQHEKFQTIAPQVEGGLYLVPQVIE